MAHKIGDDWPVTKAGDCSRCQRTGTLRCVRRRVAGKAHAYQKAIEWWCGRCRAVANGHFRYAAPVPDEGVSDG